MRVSVSLCLGLSDKVCIRCQWCRALLLGCSGTPLQLLREGKREALCFEVCTAYVAQVKVLDKDRGCFSYFLIVKYSYSVSLHPSAVTACTEMPACPQQWAAGTGTCSETERAVKLHYEAWITPKYSSLGRLLPSHRPTQLHEEHKKKRSCTNFTGNATRGSEQNSKMRDEMQHLMLFVVGHCSVRWIQLQRWDLDGLCGHVLGMCFPWGRR